MPKGIYVRTEDMRKEISERVKKAKHWENPEFRRKQIETHNTPEYKSKARQRVKESWEDPEYRGRHIDGTKKWWQSPGIREKLVESFTPERKLEIGKKTKKYWQNPENKKNDTIGKAVIGKFWSEAVKKKAGHKCECCGEKNNLASHHIYSIRNASTKWEIDNGICLCIGCHTGNTFSAHRSPEFTLWIIKYIGEERFNRIRCKANQIKKWTEKEKWGIYWELKNYVEKEVLTNYKSWNY